MIKYKTNTHTIYENYGKDRVFMIGYCDAHYILRAENARAYSCGIYGWNYDFYEFHTNHGWYGISTGYRPCGTRVDYNTTREFNEKGRAFDKDVYKTWDDVCKFTKDLLRDYLRVITGFNDLELI